MIELLAIKNNGSCFPPYCRGWLFSHMVDDKFVTPYHSSLLFGELVLA